MLLACLTGDQCSLLSQGELSFVPSRFEVRQDLLLVVDTADAVIQTTRMAGDARHAAALVERDLRTQGVMDDDAQVIIHASKKIAGEYEALYTALPRRRLTELNAWSEAQAHHVAVVPVVALLWRVLSSREGLLYRSGARLSFLANLDGVPVFRSVQAFSEDEGDLVSAGGLLAESVQAELSARATPEGSGRGRLKSLRWFTRLCAASASQIESQVALSMAGKLGLTVDVVPQDQFHDAGGSFGSSLPELAKRFVPSTMCNGVSARWAVQARNALPSLTMAAWVLTGVASIGAIGLFGWAWSKASEAREFAGKAQVLEAKVLERDARAQLPADFSETLAFVDRLDGLSVRPDLTRLLSALREAGASGIRLTRIYTVTPEPKPGKRGEPAKAQPQRIQVDALVERDTGRADGEAIAGFVAALRRRGYAAVAVEGPVRGAQQINRPMFSYELKPMEPT